MDVAKQNIDVFHVCPACGSAALRTEDDKALRCDACGFILYFNAAAAVAGLIVDGAGRLLVTVRACEPRKGEWDLPGGFVDPGESAEEALAREVREELGLRLVAMDYFCSAPNDYVYCGVTYATTDLAFLCRADDAQVPHPSDEIAGCFYVPVAELEPGRFGSPSIMEIVRRFVLSQTDAQEGRDGSLCPSKERS